MTDTDHSEEDPWITTGKVRFAAAVSPEEKLAVLRDYEDEETAQAYLSEFLRRERGEYVGGGLVDDTFTPEDLAEGVSTREGKLAVLREYYPAAQAEEALRLMELRPHLDALPTRAEKLACLRAHLPEETVQDSIEYFMQRQAEREPPPSAADAACQEEWRKMDMEPLEALVGRLSVTAGREARLAVMRDYVSEAAAQYMIRRTLDKATGDAASAG